jgi:L,D-transpeptidase ErfK/SrfK
MKVLLVTLLLLLSFSCFAATYPVLENGDLVGKLQTIGAKSEETLLDIARAHDIGQEEIVQANPGIDRWLPGDGSIVTIPSWHVLPAAPRSDLVLNLPEMRLYAFTDKGKIVHTYPVSVGRMDWKTPLGESRIVRKQKDPAWYPPDSVRQEAAEDGKEMPDMVPPGPDNPLGEYALRLNLPGYLIHGTNKPYGVGMRVTHGCIRLLPEDIEELFGKVKTGTRVRLVNQSVKLGWDHETLYMEVHPPLEEDQDARDNLLRYALELVYSELEKRPAVLLGRELHRAVEEQSGMPVAISRPDLRPAQSIHNPLFD